MAQMEQKLEITERFIARVIFENQEYARQTVRYNRRLTNTKKPISLTIAQTKQLINTLSKIHYTLKKVKCYVSGY